MRRAMLLARIAAMVIAAIGVVDPAVTSQRRVKPVIALVSGDPSRSARELLARATTELADDFEVIPGRFGKAAATVIVGSSMPTNATEISGRVFALASAPGIAIEAADAPRSASSEERVVVPVVTRTSGGAGEQVEVSLAMGGLVVDRVAARVGANGLVTNRPSFVATTPGPVALRTVARVAGARDSAVAELAVNVTDERRPVMFFDRRPSWMSTFVRRSIENDRRFVVSSRVTTSRGISTDAGRPASSLEDPTVLELYDTIIIGAPEALTAGDVAGLETFMRRRGGGVILLFDTRPASGSFERLTGAMRWTGATSSIASVITPTASDSAGLRATELAWPTATPPGAEVLARSAGDGRLQGRPVVWSMAVGSGRLVVSGALDSWKYRDVTRSGFDAFWRQAIAEAAAGATPALDLSVDRSLVAPGEMIDVTVGVRDARLASADRPVSASASAALVGPGGSREPVRLWPTSRIGEFTGSLRAPSAPGHFSLVATAGGYRSEMPMLVADGEVAQARRNDSDMIASFVGSRGGKVVGLDGLRTALDETIEAQRRVERWYPMRQGWWLAVFVTLVGMEWLWRRRQGLA